MDKPQLSKRGTPPMEAGRCKSHSPAGDSAASGGLLTLLLLRLGKLVRSR